MMLITFQCHQGCGKTMSLVTESLDYQGFSGVYSCPVCKQWNLKVLMKAEIEPTKFRIIKTIPINAKTTPAMAKPSALELLQKRQLHSPGRRDDEQGERACEEPAEPTPDGIIQPRTKPSSSKYEAEVSKYLGVPTDWDKIHMPIG